MGKNSSSVPSHAVIADAKRVFMLTVKGNTTDTPQTAWTGKARKKSKQSKTKKADTSDDEDQ